MYVHIGQDFIVPTKSIVCIIDMDTSTWSKHTRALVQRLAREGVLCAGELGEHLYLSGLSSATLQKRAEQGVSAFA